MKRCAQFLLCILALFASSCSVPLGPGFTIRKELLEAHFVPGTPAQMAVQAIFELENTGDRPLETLLFVLPETESLEANGMEASWQGAALAAGDGAALRTPLDSRATHELRLPGAWPPRAKAKLVLSYSLRGRSGPGGSAISADSFVVSPGSWYPRLIPPKHFLARGGDFPERWDVHVRLPKDFLVYAPGEPKGRASRGAETVHRFRMREEDFAPFVVAGKYSEQKRSEHNTSVHVWTFHALTRERVDRAARVLPALRDFENLYGPAHARGPQRFYIIEMHSPEQPQGTVPVVTEMVLPCAALISSRGFEEQFESQVPSFAGSAKTLWIPSWTAWVADAASDPDEPLQRALDEYALFVLDERKGGQGERASFVEDAIGSYANAVLSFGDLPISSLTEDDETHHRVVSEKALLVLLALEDEVGTAALRRAIRGMVQGLRGSEYGWTDLRAAVEAESGRDLGEFFRRWVNQTGIPEDFRKRYEK